MNVIQQLQSLRDRLTETLPRDGVLTLRRLYLQVGESRREILPSPSVTEETGNQEESLMGRSPVMGRVKRYYVEGISKERYSRRKLESSKVKYILTDNDGLEITLTLESIEEKAITWNLRLVEYQGKNDYGYY